MTYAMLWRAICFGCVLTASVSAFSQTFETLAYFSDGSTLFSSLIQGRDGDLYGTSNNGGTNGHGSVFKMTPCGELTTLYSFCSQPNCTDGFFPFSALVLGSDGNFYGTTQNGGSAGFGTVFKITTAGQFTLIHSFENTDGSAPEAGLVVGTDASLYGTTGAGGTGPSCSGGCGTIFKIAAAGTLTTLHNFSQSDGIGPTGLVLGSDGNFYGTTYGGGNNVSGCSINGGCGTVFKVTPGGKFQTLHLFNYTDGMEPLSPPAESLSGSFYGTTFEGANGNFHGCTVGCGTIFKVSSSGTFATVHKFHFGDGGNPQSGFALASDGSLYGECPLGGTMGGGEIYRLTPPNLLATEYSINPATGGGGTTAPIQETDGKFYGTYGVPGAVFSLDTGLGPFIAFVIPTGKIGKTAQILGQGLTGATSVTFNGIPASFTVVSDTFMTAVVPNGATTGSVVVTTPTGILTSNVSFRIAK